MDWAKTIARGYKKHLSFGFGATYTRGFLVLQYAINIAVGLPGHGATKEVQHDFVKEINHRNKSHRHM